MMLKQLSFFSFMIFCLGTAGQNKNVQLHYLDAQLKRADKAKAFYLAKGVFEKNLYKVNCYSMDSAKLLVTAYFTDTSLSVQEGNYARYRQDGTLAVSGCYAAGKEDGLWLWMDTAKHQPDSSFYIMGKAMRQVRRNYNAAGNLVFYDLKDSLTDTYHAIAYNDSQAVTLYVYFKGQQGLMVRHTRQGTVTDTLLARQEKDAEFPGGSAGWRTYLQRNLNTNIAIDNGAPAGQYQVKIKFVVNKDGFLTDVAAVTNHGYGMEQEVIRIIKKGPVWVPAIQAGRLVKAYRLQPVTFFVPKE